MPAPAELAPPTEDAPPASQTPVEVPTAIVAPTGQRLTATLISMSPQIVRLLPDPTVPSGGEFIGTQCANECISPAATTAVNAIPSPVGASLFSDLKVVCCVSGNPQVYTYRLAPDAVASYSYSCPAGQCIGSAEDVWRAIPTGQKQAWVEAVVQVAKDKQNWDAWGPTRAKGMVSVLVTAGTPQILLSSNHYSELAPVRVVP